MAFSSFLLFPLNNAELSTWNHPFMTLILLARREVSSATDVPDPRIRG